MQSTYLVYNLTIIYILKIVEPFEKIIEDIRNLPLLYPDDRRYKKIKRKTEEDFYNFCIKKFLPYFKAVSYPYDDLESRFNFAMNELYDHISRTNDPIPLNFAHMFISRRLSDIRRSDTPFSRDVFSHVNVLKAVEDYRSKGAFSESEVDEILARIDPHIKKLVKTIYFQGSISFPFDPHMYYQILNRPVETKNMLGEYFLNLDTFMPEIEKLIRLFQVNEEDFEILLRFLDGEPIEDIFKSLDKTSGNSVRYLPESNGVVIPSKHKYTIRFLISSYFVAGGLEPFVSSSDISKKIEFAEQRLRNCIPDNKPNQRIVPKKLLSMLLGATILTNFRNLENETVEPWHKIMVNGQEINSVISQRIYDQMKSKLSKKQLASVDSVLPEFSLIMQRTQKLVENFLSLN